MNTNNFHNIYIIKNILNNGEISVGDVNSMNTQYHKFSKCIDETPLTPYKTGGLVEHSHHIIF